MPSRRSSRCIRGLAWAASIAVAAAALTGCTPESAPPPVTSSTGPSSSAPSPTPTAGPALHPDGTAADNLPLFTVVTVDVWDSSDRAYGRAYLDALVAAGFDKAAMQVTKDTSTVGHAAESLQFSVLWGDECLIGQVGPAIGDPVTAVMPALSGGACLIGETRDIDW